MALQQVYTESGDPLGSPAQLTRSKWSGISDSGILKRQKRPLIIDTTCDSPAEQFLDEYVWPRTSTPQRTTTAASSFPLSPSDLLSPATSNLLETYECELMSPCISVKSADRGLVARPATIKDSEGIWIRLELRHTMQSLLDSCGNGRLSWLAACSGAPPVLVYMQHWTRHASVIFSTSSPCTPAPMYAQHCRFYVAVRLDIANALAVNPRHLQLISMEERADEVVVLQLLLAQPPDSALSLANVGGKLAAQVRPLEKRKLRVQWCFFLICG